MQAEDLTELLEKPHIGKSLNVHPDDVVFISQPG